MGRPSKLTAEVRERVCAALCAGRHITEAARDGGISEKTFHRWMERGERSRFGPHHQFFVAVRAALSKTREALLGVVRRAARYNWQAARFLLERTFEEAPRRAPRRRRRTQVPMDPSSEADLERLLKQLGAMPATEE